MKSFKHTILTLTTAALLFANGSCVKEMDMQRDDRIDNLRATYEQLARAYEHLRATFYAPVATSCYTGFTAGGYMMAGYCDEAQEVSQVSEVYDWYNGSVSSSEMPLWYNSPDATHRWSGLFGCIFNCNSAIRYLQDETLVTDYEKGLQSTMAAQFYALRGYAYLQLIKRFGGVPIINEMMEQDVDYSQFKRASFAQCVDFIIESCDKALATDPALPWFVGSQSLNPQLSRTVIWAVKSEAALYAASPLWADDYAGTQPYTWERAASITKAALDLCMGHGAKLVDNTTKFPIESDFGLNAYDKYFLSAYPSGLAWDTETLFQPYNYGWAQSEVWCRAGLPIDAGQYSAGACPTQEMVDAYEVVSADGTQSVPLLDLANPYNADGTPNINPAARALGYEDCTDKMYLNRDPRFYSTIYYDGVTFELQDGEFEVETAVGGNCGLNLSPANRRNTCTGYYLRKFSNPQSGTDAGNKCGYMRVFRLAELYLNFAEAAYKAYGPDYSMPPTNVEEPKADSESTEINTYGVPMSAREAVNAVRARVGMPGITDTGNDFWLRLCNERRVELAFEEHRFFDVRRWTSPDGDLSKTDKRVSGMRIEVKNGVKAYSRFSFDRNCYTNKFLKYPIDLDEIRTMIHHTGENWQNRGWN